MKAIDILDVLSREPVSSDQFGVIHIGEPMSYADFIKRYIYSSYEASLDECNYLVRGAIFYCWSDDYLDFPTSKDVDVLEIGGGYTYIIEVE